MLDSKVILVFMIFLSAVLIFGFLNHSTAPKAGAQSLYNESSVASSTVCMNDQPCQTLVCSENQPCTTSKTPNIPDPSDLTDHLEDREDTLEDFE
ncbi:hypothetical protein BH18THE2_BH18THE2_05320 [soil metagenome]